MTTNDVDEHNYTTEELKAICAAIQADIMHNTADGSLLGADMIELQDEYQSFSSALERKLAYDRTD